MPTVNRSTQISKLNISEINAALSQLQVYIDELAGMLGDVTIYNDVEVQGSIQATTTISVTDDQHTRLHGFGDV